MPVICFHKARESTELIVLTHISVQWVKPKLIYIKTLLRFLISVFMYSKSIFTFFRARSGRTVFTTLPFPGRPLLVFIMFVLPEELKLKKNKKI